MPINCHTSEKVHKKDKTKMICNCSKTQAKIAPEQKRIKLYFQSTKDGTQFLHIMNKTNKIQYKFITNEGMIWCLRYQSLTEATSTNH